MSTNDGGQAFPLSGYTIDLGIDDDGEPIIGHGKPMPGMSLRDWFAGMALATDCVEYADSDMESVAKRAYEVADAMIAEREKKHE